MSGSLTVRPSAGRTVGRGRGRGRGRGTQQNQKPGTKMNSSQFDQQVEGENDGISQNNGQQQGQIERMQRRDAYTVISPNEKKRQQITTQAKQGEDAYRKHKEEKKLGHVSYVGTVGGGEVNRVQARQSMQAQQQSTLSPFAKSQKYREIKRKEEDAKLQKMKDEQRRKTERNIERDSARQRRHTDEHRARNAAFLDKIEQESKQKQQQLRQEKVLSSSAARNTEDLPSPAETSSQYDGTACAPARYSSNSESPLQALQRRYPHCDVDVLNDLLLQMNGDVSAVCDMLG